MQLRSITLQQHKLPLKRNCYILGVRINLKIVQNFNYCIIFFYAQKASFGIKKDEAVVKTLNNPPPAQNPLLGAVFRFATAFKSHF